MTQMLNPQKKKKNNEQLCRRGDMTLKRRPGHSQNPSDWCGCVAGESKEGTSKPDVREHVKGKEKPMKERKKNSLQKFRMALTIAAKGVYENPKKKKEGAEKLGNEPPYSKKEAPEMEGILCEERKWKPDSGGVQTFKPQAKGEGKGKR